MTNQEAIETIKSAQSQIEWDYPMDYAAAFDMAITALQAQEAFNNLATDTISRQAAIDAAIEAADDWDGGCSKERERFIRDALEKLPSAQPERDKGHWIVKWDDEVKTTYGECSRCGCVQYAGVTNFCHECGADMREESNEKRSCKSKLFAE